MTSRLIAVAGVLAILAADVAVADEKTEMKKNRDPMTEETSRPLPRETQGQGGTADKSDSRVAKAACAKQTGPAREACMEEMKNTYGIAPFGSRKPHKSFRDDSTRFGRT